MVNHTFITILDENVPSRDFAGTVCVAMRPLVEVLGLAWKPQYLVLKEGRYKGHARLMPFKAPGAQQFRRMLGLPLSLVNEWAYSINLHKVRDSLVLDNILTFREELDAQAEASAESVLIEARVLRLGEGYRSFPLQPVERKLLHDMRKPGQQLMPIAAILGYPHIMQQAKQRMDMLSLISEGC